eukprot:15472174-Alexandrium_andersonii.AAC.1
MPSHDRVYLNVPFSERHEAMALGAKWDPKAKLWYVASGSDPGKFAKEPVEGIVEFSDSPPCNPPQSRPLRSVPQQDRPRVPEPPHSERAWSEP